MVDGVQVQVTSHEERVPEGYVGVGTVGYGRAQGSGDPKKGPGPVRVETCRRFRVLGTEGAPRKMSL